MNRLLLLLLLFCAQISQAQPISWLTDCAEKNFCLNPGSCTQGNVFIAEQAITNCGSPTVNYSYKIDLNNDGGLEIQSSEDTVRGNFTKGTHKIIWRASDNCGSVIQCTYLFHIKDCSPPNLICINGLTQTIDPPLCEATFGVNQFILNTTDNCTPADQIQRGIRVAGTGVGFPDNQTVTFGICDNGFNQLELWVRDENGLTNQCSNYVLIQSSDPACDCFVDADLQFTGCARSANNARLSSYRVISTVKKAPNVQPTFSKIKTATVTDSCFSLLVEDAPLHQDYEAVVRAEKPDAALNGVTTFDLVLISKHILGIEPLSSAYQMEAADVNNSNSITTLDIVETRKLILGIVDTFPQVPSWRFVKPLPNPGNLPSYTALQDTYQVQIPNLQVDQNFQNFNFVGIKYGDINFTAAAMKGEADDRSDATPLLLQTDDRWLKPGEEATLSFRLGNTYDLDGWQLVLEADPTMLTLQAVSGLSENSYQLTDNVLRVVCLDETGTRRPEANGVVLVLKVRAIQSVRLSHALQLNEDKLLAEAYVPNAAQKTIRRPLLFRFDAEGLYNIKHFAVTPNPFSTEANFNIILNEPAPALLEIFTLDGRKVYGEHFDLEAGRQSIRLTQESLPTGKMFVYRFWVNGEVFTGKLVRV